jgi:hypothetical protein
VADSVLFFQHEDGEQVTVRDIRLQMEQDEHHHATVDFPAGSTAISAIWRSLSPPGAGR